MKKTIIFLTLIFILIQGYSQDSNFQEKFDKHIIYSTDIDSIVFPDYFKQQNVIDSISKNFGNWHRRALAIEDYLINNSSVQIKIDSTTRTVILQNGTKKILTPNAVYDEAGYTFEKEFKKLNLLLFRVQWYEGNSYFLLNTKTGERTYTIGRVYINPNNTLMISINDDIEAGYSYNGFELFKIEENGNLKKLWELSTSWAPKKIKWLNNYSFIVGGYTYPITKKGKFKQIFKKITIKKME